MEIDARLLSPDGEPENIENFNRVLKMLDQASVGGVTLDTTLTQAGQAADAKAAGDRITALEGKTALATTAAPGIVKQAASVPKAAAAPTKEEFDALIDALVAAGLMASGA